MVVRRHPANSRVDLANGTAGGLFRRRDWTRVVIKAPFSTVQQRSAEIMSDMMAILSEALSGGTVSQIAGQIGADEKKTERADLGLARREATLEPFDALS